MAYGTRYFAVTMTSGALSSTVADLGGAYQKLYLAVPTMASGSLYLRASADNSTYFRVMHDVVNSSAAQIHTFTIDSACTQRLVPIPFVSRYMKVESTSGATDVVTTFQIVANGE
jgi:hypothetical protein